MSAGYQGNPGISVDALDELLEERLWGGTGGESAPSPAAAHGPAVEATPTSSRRVALEDPFPRRLDAWNSPDADALSTVLRRCIRTATPLLVADLLSLLVAAVLAQQVVMRAYGGEVWPASWICWALVGPILLAYWLGGLYSEIWVHPAVELRQMTHSTTVVLFTAAVAGLLVTGLALWCVVAWGAVVVLMPLLRAIARRMCAVQPWWGYPTLVVGSGAGADAVARTLLKSATSGLCPVLISDLGGERRVSILPVLTDTARVESIVRAKAIRHAVLSLPEMSTARLSEIIDRYSAMVPHLLLLGDCSALPTLWGASRNCGMLSRLEVHNGLMVVTLQRVKRALDLGIAVIALILGLPVIAGIALLVKLTSAGPVLYGHTRIGQHGRMFTAWKFRTMYQDCDAILERQFARDPAARLEWQRDQKLRHDPRITRIGKFLRTSSLDELPQLWNVLKGEMSLVGPRPIIEAEVSRYGEIFKVYATVKPGITGLWQVSGRTDIGYEQRVRLDEFYVRHCSLWLDLYILASTVMAVIRRNGAY